jgi:hypothetical protein
MNTIRSMIQRVSNTIEDIDRAEKPKHVEGIAKNT